MTIQASYTVQLQAVSYDLGDCQGDLPDYYTSPELHIESDNPQIQALSQQLAKGLKTPCDKVRAFYNYVGDHLVYSYNAANWGAQAALGTMGSDCTEYSDLFAALCRAKEIPARVVSGYVASYDTARSKHNWVEVYLQDYGWVPFDPSSGDIRSDYFRNLAFSMLRPAYIYFSNIRNDELLNGYQFARFTYRGRRIKVTDSIEFKQPD